MAATRSLRFSEIVLLLAIPVIFGLAKSGHAQTQPPDPLELGSSLYKENCLVCHGPDGQGRVGATLAKDWPSIRPDLTVRAIIENGVTGSVMPAWGQAKGGPLTEAEIDALVQYILSWQTGGASQVTPQATATLVPPLTPIPNVVGDPNRGAVLFAENCVVCHGPRGEGRIGATLARAWSGIRPDLNIRNTIVSGITGSLMPAWSSANGGPLSEQEIDDLVAFLLVLQRDSPVTMVSPVAPPIIPPGESPLNGWLGVLLFLVLSIALIAAVLLLQRRKE